MVEYVAGGGGYAPEQQQQQQQSPVVSYDNPFGRFGVGNHTAAVSVFDGANDVAGEDWAHVRDNQGNANDGFNSGW